MTSRAAAHASPCSATEMKRHALLIAAVLPFLASAGATHTDELRRILLSGDRSYVFVALHQGDHSRFPGNSRECILGAIEMGADVVEIDVRRTTDGRFVLSHDPTDAQGLVTLEEALSLTRGKILVNIDKFDSAPKEIFDEVKRLGCLKEVLLKSNATPDEARTIFGDYWNDVVSGDLLFMPMIQYCWGQHAHADGILPQWLALEPRKAAMYEVCVDREAYLDRIGRVMSAAGSPRLWMNAMWDDLCADHAEAPVPRLAVGKPPRKINPDAVWGWMLDQGATMIQTDNGRELIRYLEKKGRRRLTESQETIRPGAHWARLDNPREIVPGSALDFSSIGGLDAPAGKYGWLRNEKGGFAFEKSGAVPVRFHGINLCYTANYPNAKTAEILIDRLARLGYNSIRLHHHDDMWSHDPDSRDSLDYLISVAINRGFYVFTDLYVSRETKFGDMSLFKTLVTVDDEAFAEWCRFAEAFMNHVNPYTGRAYKDEPGLPLVSLVNEPYLGMSWSETGKATNETLLAAWRKFSRDPRAKEVPSPWGRDVRVQDFDEALGRAFFAKASAFLRGIGVKALLTHDNNGSRHGETSLAIRGFDFVDTHYYFDHPVYPGPQRDFIIRCSASNPFSKGEPAVFGTVQPKSCSRPYVISEWNFCGPSRFRSAGGLAVGACAARDGWDGLWRFAYAHAAEALRHDGRFGPDAFNCAQDPVMQAGDRAVACLFARGDGLSGSVSVDRQKGTLSVVSDATCGVFAEAGQAVRAGVLGARPMDVPACVWASSLDGKPLADSSRILVVHLTDAQGDGAVFEDGARGKLLKWGRGCLVEKGSARVAMTVRNPSELAVFALDGTGARRNTVPSSEHHGRLEFTPSTAEGTIYYEIVRR